MGKVGWRKLVAGSSALGVLVLRVALLEDSGVSAAELVYEPLFSSWPVIDCCQASTDHFSSAAVVSPSLCSGQDWRVSGSASSALQATFMFIRMSSVLPDLSLAYCGPYRMCVCIRVRRQVPGSIGRLQTVSANNIKPQLGTTPVSAASAPCCGHPPLQFGL
jgi:hypothetical protein